MQLLEVKSWILCVGALSTGLANGACSAPAHIEKCVMEYHQKADAALNRQYQGVMSGLSDDMKSRLKSAQRAWIEYRQRTCGSLNGLDGASCESSLSDQRTRELYFIEMRWRDNTGLGVVDFISKEFLEGDEGVLTKLLSRQPQIPSWSNYASQHCSIMSDLVGGDILSCKVRLIFINWNGF